ARGREALDRAHIASSRHLHRCRQLRRHGSDRLPTRSRLRPGFRGCRLHALDRGIVHSSMDFAYTADEQAFAAEVRRFLAEHPPDRFAVDGMDAGYGSGSHSRPFLRALADQGWLSMTWPKAYGGQERPMFFKLVLLE